MKAKRAWVRFEADYKEWQFIPTKPDYAEVDGWIEIVYFEVEA